SPHGLAIACQVLLFFVGDTKEKKPIRRYRPRHVSTLAIKIQRLCYIPTGGNSAASRCPLWVISGHVRCNRPCPLYPRKRTWRCKRECPLWPKADILRVGQAPASREARWRGQRAHNLNSTCR